MKRYRRRREGSTRTLVLGILAIAAITAGLFFGVRALWGLFAGSAPAPSATPTPPPQIQTPAPTPEPTIAPPEEIHTPSERDLYRLDLRMDADAKALSCVQQVVWTNRTGSPATEAVFRMYPNALTHGADSPVANLKRVFPNGADTNGIEINRVLAEGESASWTLDGKLGTTLRVPFAQDLADGESAEITISWQMKLPKGFYPLSHSATGLQAAWFYPVSATFVQGKWQLTDVAQSGAYPWYYPAADYEAVIRVTGNYTLMSTGTVEHQSKSGEETVYSVAARGARDFAFCLTSHDKSAVETTESGVRIATRAQYNDRSRELAGLAAKLVTFYEGVLGPCPVPEIELVQATLTGNASTHAGLIMVDTALFSGKKAELETAVAFAVARQWLGCSVGAGFADDRDLLTPMAGFMAYLYFDQTNSAVAETALALPGAKTMRELRTSVGTSRFDPALLALCSEYAAKKVTTAEFAALCGDSEAEVLRALGS